MAGHYCSLSSALKRAKRIVIENRPKKFLFGTNNYGEITGSRMRNRADGDNWDIVCPGYPVLPRKEYRLKDIEGIIFLPNGNHKIVVDVHTTHKRYSKKAQEAEIKRYMKNYTKYTKIPTTYCIL